MVVVTGGKLDVQPPGNFVWGIKTPYTTAVKTSTGINILTLNKTVKNVSYGDISNSTVPTNYVSALALQQWYKKFSSRGFDWIRLFIDIIQ